MAYLYGFALLGIVASTIADIQKTKRSLKTAWKLFLKMMPMLLITLIIVSVVLYFLPDYLIAKYLGTNNVLVGAVLATVIGSISLLPGFITFPLSGLLLKQGVSYTVIAAFTTSLMMVGVATLPIESKYLGFKLSLIRNIASFVIAVIVSIIIGLLYGEVL